MEVQGAVRDVLCFLTAGCCRTLLHQLQVQEWGQGEAPPGSLLNIHSFVLLNESCDANWSCLLWIRYRGRINSCRMLRMTSLVIITMTAPVGVLKLRASRLGLFLPLQGVLPCSAEALSIYFSWLKNKKKINPGSKDIIKVSKECVAAPCSSAYWEIV